MFESTKLYQKQQDSFHYIGNPLTDDIEQIYECLLIIDHHIVDENSNEVVFSPEQAGFINSVIDEIRELLRLREVEKAKIKLVALQMVMGIQVRHYPILMRIIEEDWSLNEILNDDEYLNHLVNGLGRGGLLA